ncbi:MAG: hypothetical protein N3D15_06910 [Syntrophorhabdaceae bacterium]|nr:hypothetical protein [Syntrophorhabdaceae bacterium]
MTQKDSKNYAGKRKDSELNQKIAALIKEKAKNNRISCVSAHTVATQMNIDPNEVGKTIDLLELKIIECQLGLFGYENKKNIPVLSEAIDPEIESAITEALVDGRLPCLSAWNISKRFKILKPVVTAICESKKIKISSCQLGAF